MKRLAGISLCVGIVVCSLWAQDGFPYSHRCDLLTSESPDAAFGACLEPDKLDGKSFTVPKNVTRIDRTGMAICLPPEYGEVQAADVVFVVDWSGSMKDNDKAWYTPQATRQAMELLHQMAPNSTAGWIAFAGDVCEDIPLKPMNAGSNYENLIAKTQYGKDVADCYNHPYKKGTNWYASLSQARKWLLDDSQTRHSTQAIVFLTDGNPSYGFASGPDQPNRNHLVPLYNELIQEPDFPPVHAIFIDGNSAELQTLTQRTGGGFYEVGPNDAQGLQTAMNSIVSAVVGSRKPTSVQLSNLDNGMKATADQNTMTGGGSGRWQMQLSDLIALREGDNRLELKYQAETIVEGKTSKEEKTARFTVAVSGAARDREGKADISNSPLAVSCREKSSLTVTDASGKAIQQIPHSASNYGLSLKTGSSDLKEAKVQVKAEGSKDSENLTLVGSGGELDANQKFAGISGGAKTNNGVTEAFAKDELRFTWAHPNDPRDVAVLTTSIMDDGQPHLVEALFIPEAKAFRKGDQDTLYTVFSSEVKPVDKTAQFFSLEGEGGAYRFQLEPLDTQGTKLRFLVKAIEGVTYPTHGDSIWLLDGYYTTPTGKAVKGDPANRIMLKVRAPVTFFKFTVREEIPRISEESAEAFQGKDFLVNVVHSQAEFKSNPGEPVGSVTKDMFNRLEGDNAGVVVEFRANQGFKADVRIFSHYGQFVNNITFEVAGDVFNETDSEGEGIPIRMIWSGKGADGRILSNGVYVFRILMTYQPNGIGKTREEVKLVRVGLLREEG